MLPDTLQMLISFRYFSGIYIYILKFGENSCMGLDCGTPTNFMPTPAIARTMQGMTITPPFMGWGLKCEKSPWIVSLCTSYTV